MKIRIVVGVNGSLRILNFYNTLLSSWCLLSPLYSDGQTSESRSNSNRFLLVLKLTLAHPPGLTPSPDWLQLFPHASFPNPTNKLHNGLAHGAEHPLT